jgi:pilus assembly protein FimV
MIEIKYSWFSSTMPDLTLHRSPLYVAITMLGLATPLAHSVTLGELQMQSYVGQQFRGLVPYRLNAGETIHEQCIELQHGNSDLPNMGAATIQLRPSSEQSGAFLIESRSAVGEPMVAFAIKIACGNQQISRDFTAFLNIAPVNNERETLTRFTPREVERKSAIIETTPLKQVEEFIVKKPITLKELTKRYYPANSPQYPRYLQKLSNTNPTLDPNTELSVGTTVIIPERLRSTKKKSNPTTAIESGQLRLDAATPSANTKPAAPQSAAQYTKDLEQKVKMLEDLQLQMQLEVEQLNQKISQLNAVTAVASPVAVVATVAPVVASAVQTSSAAASQVVITPAESKPASGFSRWLIGAGLALLAASVALIAWRRRQSQDDHWSPEQDPTAHTFMGQLNALTKRSKSTEHVTMMSMMQAPGQGIEVSDYGSNDLAQIQIMLAQGDVSEAIDLLYQSIDEDPADIERWLMLFRVFRQQGMKTEYAALAKNLRLVVKDEADWELVRNIGAKLDPENHLYRRTENPLGEVASGTRPAVPQVDLDIHPETTPASMMRAFLETSPKPLPPAAFVPTVPAAAAIDEIMLDLHLPDTTGNQIQGTDTINPNFDTLPVFEMDLLPPFNTDDANLNWDEPSMELAPQEPKPPKSGI